MYFQKKYLCGNGKGIFEDNESRVERKKKEEKEKIWRIFEERLD
jgi:hypothetical protein